MKGGHLLALVGAPEEWAIPDLDPGVAVRRDLGGDPDVVIDFVRSQSELHTTKAALLEALRPGGALWVAWPRKAGGHVSDVTE